MAVTSVTIRLDETVWRRTRAYAFLNGVTASSIVEGFLRELVMDTPEGSSDGADDQLGSEDMGDGQDHGLRAEHVGKQAGRTGS